MASKNFSEEINELFKLLMRIHKSLIDFQKLVTEAMEQKQYSPYTVLQLAFNHPEFAWLRKISTIMADMDESTSDKKKSPDENDLKEFARRLDEIFSENSQDEDFRKRLNIALNRDGKLADEIKELRGALTRVLAS